MSTTGTTGMDDADWAILIGGTVLLIGMVVWSIIQGIMGTFGITLDQFTTGVWAAILGGVVGGFLWSLRYGNLGGIVSGLITGAGTPYIGWTLVGNTDSLTGYPFIEGFILTMIGIYVMIQVGRFVATLLNIWLSNRNRKSR